ncbi:hypothetical protein [Leptospira wolffii]|uniref:hypothetical protein n=1 Tax=Leptospira wolffii TaxID=409998 RepID=UPI0012EC4C21|nr:hypothetical protein [Leptospira wolffii]
MYWVFAILIILLIPGLLKINFKYFANIQLFSRNLLDLFYNKILIIPFMLIGLALHVLSLSLIFSDVKFITDKALYSKQDKLLVSIKRSGYIYLPKIIKTTFNGKLIYLNGARSGFGNLTNLIDLTTADISSDNAFEAEYITQFISYTRKTELFVIIAP